MNKKNLFLKTFAVVMVAVLLAGTLGGCSFIKGGEKEFDEYLEELFTALFSGDGTSINFLLSNPAAYGLDEETASVPTPSAKEDYEKGYSSLKMQSKLMRLMFNYNDLNEKQQVWYDYLATYFNNRSDYKDFYYFQDDFLGSYLGFQAELPIYLAEYGFSRKHDIENFFNLINSAAENFPKYVDYERERVQNGYGRADFVYVGSIEQCENFTGVDIRGGETQNTETENFLIPLFKSKIANCSFLTEEEKATYNDRIAPAVNDVLIPAYVKLGQGVTEFIGNENNNQKGLAHYENGKKYYELLFRDATGVSDSVETALQKILTDYNASISESKAIVSKIQSEYGLSSDEISDKLDALMDSDLENWTIDKMYDTVGELRGLIANDFPALTACGQIVLKEIDPSLKDNYSPAAYFTSKLDDMNANQVIIVNTYSDNLSSYNTFDLLSHEGFPGHLYQDVYFKNSGLPKTIRAMSSSGYMEGWATYAENYAAKYFRPDTLLNLLYKLYLLENKTSQYIVATADIKVNYEGLDKAELRSFLLDTFYSSAAGDAAMTNAVSAYSDRVFEHVVEVPTNVLKYYYTALKITELRTLCAQMSDLEFHTEMMKYGPVLLDQYYAKLTAN